MKWLALVALFAAGCGAPDMAATMADCSMEGPPANGWYTVTSVVPNAANTDVCSPPAEVGAKAAVAMPLSSKERIESSQFSANGQWCSLTRTIAFTDGTTDTRVCAWTITQQLDWQF